MIEKENVSWKGQPVFYVVEAISASWGRKEWEIVGIYSKKEEAEAFAEELKNKGDIVGGSVVTQLLPLNTIKNLLIRDRLKELTEPLQNLERLKVIIDLSQDWDRLKELATTLQENSDQLKKAGKLDTKEDSE